jgi:hypothetical protein
MERKFTFLPGEICHTVAGWRSDSLRNKIL